MGCCKNISKRKVYGKTGLKKQNLNLHLKELENHQSPMSAKGRKKDQRGNKIETNKNNIKDQ